MPEPAEAEAAALKNLIAVGAAPPGVAGTGMLTGYVVPLVTLAEEQVLAVVQAAVTPVIFDEYAAGI